MQDDPRYDDVVAEIVASWRERVRRAVEAGIAASGSASTRGSASARRSGTTCGSCGSWTRLVLGRPVVIGVSRKRFLAR